MEPPKKATMEYQDRSYPERNVFPMLSSRWATFWMLLTTMKTQGLHKSELLCIRIAHTTSFSHSGSTSPSLSSSQIRFLLCWAFLLLCFDVFWWNFYIGSAFVILQSLFSEKNKLYRISKDLHVLFNCSFIVGAPSKMDAPFKYSADDQLKLSEWNNPV